MIRSPPRGGGRRAPLHRTVQHNATLYCTLQAMLHHTSSIVYPKLRIPALVFQSKWLAGWHPQFTSPRRVPPGAPGCPRVPPGAAGCPRVPPGAAGCPRVPPGAAGCRRVPQGAAGYHQIVGDTLMMGHQASHFGQRCSALVSVAQRWNRKELQGITGNYRESREGTPPLRDNPPPLMG